jgi:hypothetical protein
VYGRIAQTDVSRKINGSHIKRHSLESVSRCELLEDFLSSPIGIHLNLQDLGVGSAFTRLLQFLSPQPPQILPASVPTCEKTKLLRIREHPDLSPNTHGLNPIVVIK